ncbi:MAG: hypothetical protein GEU93_09790 [Propionibacteriales bacterium]|nr:hypothetical protein [Propionibacteriales bacterium]
MATSEQNKVAVRRLVEEVMNDGRMEVVDEVYDPDRALGAKRWIRPFRAAFPDVHMEIVDLVAEGETVVGRFLCSGTHQGTWRGHEPTGRRFERVDEVYFFTFRDGKIISGWGIEDTASRLRQLGLQSRADRI